MGPDNLNINICRKLNVLVYYMNVWPIWTFQYFLNNLIYIICVLKKMRDNEVNML